MMTSFDLALQRCRERIDRELEELVRKVGEGGEQAVVYDAMRYSLLAGGKRLRPILTLEFCRMLGGNPEAALPLALAVEAVHCYSLIHDDLPCMDDDDLRRGKPSCHVVFGEANALLAGDALLTLAFELIGSADAISADVKAKAVSVLSRCAGAAGMIGGQAIDLKYEGKAAGETVLTQMVRLKTSALLKAACELGVLAAGGEARYLELAEKYADALGLSFQIVDDILDVIGDEAELGKPVGSDAEKGKNTFAALYGPERAGEIADGYTAAAIQAAEAFPDHGFLLELTRRLSKRNH